MFKIKAKGERRNLSLFTFYFFLFLAASLCAASEQPNTAQTPDGLEGLWDPAKYIDIDEIKPGMKAHCLTVYGIAGIEKFSLEVVDVVRNKEPGRNAILVRGTDERFIHTGPVGGCSGSPVYIDGRLAGALAFGWLYSKDPLYGATPIAEMLAVGRAGNKKPEKKYAAANTGYTFDFSRPIDFAEIDRQITAPRFSRNSGPAGAAALPCPLITSGLPAEVCKQLKATFEPLGFMVVPGIGGNAESGAENEQPDDKLVPGACLAVPLVSGDISMGVYGTVTEVRGDKVYGFGHTFLGYGSVDLPMATGKVHTVISSLLRSTKLCSMGQTVGAMTTDEGVAVLGQLGATARTFPLTIRVDRYNDPEKRVYNCRVSKNLLYTPSSVRSAVAGAVLYMGSLPPDHSIEYKVAIDIEGFDPITFENVSAGTSVSELLAESAGSILLLMANPYKEVDIKSVDFDIRVTATDITSHIWSVNLSDSKVKAGEDIHIEAIIEKVLAGKKKYRCSLKIPDDLPPGKYELTVCGSRDYEQFLLKTVPYRYIGRNLTGLVEAINKSLKIDRDRLYCLLSLPTSGLTVEAAELPDLPATKMMVLQNAKRTLQSRPYQHWLEKTIETGMVIIDKKVLRITVEK